MGKSIYSAEQVVLQEILKRYRGDAKLSQVELSTLLGKPQSFVSKYESGQRRLDLVELQSICRCLGVSLGSLVKRFEKRCKDLNRDSK